MTKPIAELGNLSAKNIIEEIREELYLNRDLKYRDFHSKLVPNLDKKNIIGVRTPVLRKIAKKFSKHKDIELFLEDLPHRYYEENNLHCFILCDFKDISILIEKADIILPYIDNWATCDTFSPKIFKKYPDIVLEKIMEWIKSDRTYTVRYGIVLLMENYLDDEFNPDMLNIIAGIKSEEYYVNMAIAWYFSFALIKQYEITINLIESKVLDKFVHNKTIQKAVESRRISDERKQYLKSLKIK